MQSSLVPNAWANQLSVKIALVPDCVFVPTGWACSLISSFKDVTLTLRGYLECWSRMINLQGSYLFPTESRLNLLCIMEIMHLSQQKKFLPWHFPINMESCLCTLSTSGLGPRTFLIAFKSGPRFWSGGTQNGNGLFWSAKTCWPCTWSEPGSTLGCA